MMRKRIKVTVVLLTFALGAALCIPMNKVQATEVTEAPATTEAPAATKQTKKPYMKTLKKAKFDLKENKAVSFKTYWRGVGRKAGATAKITNLKYSDAKKEGYKKISFTVTFKDSYRPSKSEVEKIVKASGNVLGNQYIWVGDYNTGLNADTVEGVNVKFGSWKHSGYWIRYSTNNDYYVYAYDQHRNKVTITYPEDYKGLCIGVGGALASKQTKADKKFDKGEVPFGKSPYLYSKKATNFHFMRLNK
ncbi:MAG: hypothetical protein K2H34_05335 [Lachnospiraceae bacterium]|nr:hypothetical protein [Lachnospiraceae bacterium]